MSYCCPLQKRSKHHDPGTLSGTQWSHLPKELQQAIIKMARHVEARKVCKDMLNQVAQSGVILTLRSAPRRGKGLKLMRQVLGNARDMTLVAHCTLTALFQGGSYPGVKSFKVGAAVYRFTEMDHSVVYRAVCCRMWVRTCPALHAWAWFCERFWG